jgi:hypothetical protein
MNNEFTEKLKKVLYKNEIPKYIDSYAFTQLIIELGCSKPSDI